MCIREELWVTEPGADRVEVLKVTLGNPPTLASAGFIGIDGGPESLVIDATRSRAYTHLWHAKTVAIDLKTKAVVANWENGCDASRGIALDEARGLLFAACSEGKVTALDVDDGALLSDLAEGT